MQGSLRSIACKYGLCGFSSRAMQLLLARHGNTFAAGDEVVWVGKRNDLALVERGREQARSLARALARAGKIPTQVRCGPLARTREHAEIIARELSLPAALCTVDERLDELDYGAWSGLSAESIVQRFGPEELDAWRERSVWPRNAGWEGSEAAVKAELHSLVEELAADAPTSESVVLFVSSNGRLRYFLDLVDGEFDRRVRSQSFAVATGRLCRLDLAPEHKSVRYWNVDPAAAQSL